MYKDIVGNDLPTWFFISFWIIVDLIILNVVIAVILEIYGTAQDKVEINQRRFDAARKLEKKYGNDKAKLEADYKSIEAELERREVQKIAEEVEAEQDYQDTTLHGDTTF